MMMDGTIKGQALCYRPVSEGELSGAQRRRIAEARAREEAMACGQRSLVAAAGRNVDGFEALARWVVAVVKPGQERIACEELEAVGIEYWCPMGSERRPPKRGKHAVNIMRPVFHGYLFLRLMPSPEAWVGAICAARIGGYLGVDGVPHLLPDRFVNELRLNVKKPSVAMHAPKMRPGMRAEVQDGPFRHFIATVRRVTGGGKRVEAEIELFGGLSRVEFDVDDLRI